MKRRFRLTRSTDFQRVRRFGRSYAHPLLVLIALSNQENALRIGVVAGRLLGNAVQRNRVKRQIRAAISPYQSSLETGWDILIIARRPLVGATFSQLQDSLQTLLNRAQLLRVVQE